MKREISYDHLNPKIWCQIIPVTLISHFLPSSVTLLLPRPNTLGTSGQRAWLEKKKNPRGFIIYKTLFQMIWQERGPPGAHHWVKNGNWVTCSKEEKWNTRPPHTVFSTPNHVVLLHIVAQREGDGRGEYEEVVSMRGSMNQMNIEQAPVQLLRSC